MPVRVRTDCCETNSRSVPSNMRPPTEEYSPSVFSRTTKKSISAGVRFASGVRAPGMRRQGRRLTYWSNTRRIGMSRPQSETWSGTPGQPTAPRKMLSLSRSRSSPSSGIMRPVCL